MTHSSIDADTGSLPDVLASPPWLARKKTRPGVVELDVVPAPVRLKWLPGEQEEWAGIQLQSMPETSEAWTRELERAAEELEYPLVQALAAGPEELTRPYLRLLAQVPVNRLFGFNIYYYPANGPHGPHNDPHRKLLGRYGIDVADVVLAATRHNDHFGAPLLMPLVGAEITGVMLGWLERDDLLAAAARKWFERNAVDTVPDLIPAAVGKGVKARREAEQMLWSLDRGGHRELIRTAAASFGADVAAVIDEMLDRDPLLRLPTRIPKSPSWLDVAELPRIRLRDSAEMVPVAAVEHLVSMLMMCSPDGDYAGVALASAALDPTSRGEFVWALYRQWVSAKYPAKRNMWPLRALGLLGDNATAARLRTLAEGDRAVNRAAEALDMLALMGTRDAHMHIQLVLENSSWPYVRGRARGIIADLAAGFGITPAEFADRAVPDLGLSEQGTFTVDYGPRRFTVGLDDELDPIVREEDGTVRSNLPKPGKTDGPAAPAAYAAFGSFKKALKAAIADQSTRLETAMVLGRRWSVVNQRTLFVDHPLLRQLARRLVWTTFDADGTPGAAFRIDVDGTLADLDDNRIDLADDVSVGIAHPLHLGESTKRWAETFADYNLVQPFPQLERTSFAPGSPESAAGVDPYRDLVVPTGKLLGLNRFGWAKGYGENGSTTRFIRTVPGGSARAVLYISPGIDGRNPMGVAEQTIAALRLPDDLDLSDLGPIAASELLRELDFLR
ncbi:DUF4132 domain-containing protein [Nocardia sp. NPDC005978]|uniref:DUF4132 domain-containing protein n=1 Tax=Nocardia sp. NPDC005978 TaxID=3156725 RepID=UPI0033AAAF21